MLQLAVSNKRTIFAFDFTNCCRSLTKRKRMLEILKYLLSTGIVYLMMILLYGKFSKGLSRRSRHQQGWRFLITSALVSLPLAISGISPGKTFVVPAVVAVMWALAYPLTYHLSYRASTSDYDNYTDINFGAYCWGLLSACHLLVCSLADTWQWTMAVITIAELLLLFIPVAQIVYFLLYDICIDSNGMKAIQESHINEVLEFIRSFSLLKLFGWILLGMALCVGIVYFNFHTYATIDISMLQTTLLCAIVVFYIYYMFKPHRGAFVRTGFVTLWNVIVDYSSRNRLYESGKSERLKDLQVSPLVPFGDTPHTIVMVIGESASRDYMSAFTPQPRETTPWLSEKKKDERHFILFPNTFSCAMQTVPTLERALTERNQYNDKSFNDSCSIIDIAHKLGYTTHWYSNQGHLGAADTPITIVAETCGTAKWTKQYVGKVQYDETLLEFLDEVDPAKNNLLVVHLKGSHFNFSNRYPENYSEAQNTPKDDVVEQYRTSLHYSDSILRQIFDYANERLNMQAMLYFSDHATIPNKRRSPNFNGYGMVRIPMFVYCSDKFIEQHHDRYEALKNNCQRYFTNDLVYELMCGLMDVSSSHFDPSNSIAYSTFKYEKEDLRTNEGATVIDD